MEYNLVRFDWAMKRLLRNKANFDILEGFLSELLQREITINNILESESNQFHAEDKSNKVDILAEISHKEQVIIELQVQRELDYINRMIYGAAKLSCESLDKGRPYALIKKVIAVHIVYFNLGKGTQYLYHGNVNFRAFDYVNGAIHYLDDEVLELTNAEKECYTQWGNRPLNQGHDLQFSDIFPEFYLIRVDKFNDIINSKLDEWLYVLKNSKARTEFNARGIKKAEETLNTMHMNRKERMAYDEYLEGLSLQASLEETQKIELKMAEESGLTEGKEIGIAEGKEIGIAEGKEIGIAEGKEIGIAEGKEIGIVEGKEIGIAEGKEIGATQAKIDMARAFLTRGTDVDLVSEISGLSREELINLIH